MDNEKIIIVVPCFNEEKRIQRAKFLESLGKNKSLHWLFVDDGSTDQTATVLQIMADEFPERVFIKRLPKNSGKGEAVRQGLLQALASGAQVTGYYDADLATPMEEVYRLLKIFSSNHAKVLLGSRVFLLGRRIERKIWRFWLGRCFALLASSILRLRVYDTQCGMKIMSNFPRLKLCLDEPFVSRWLFDVELIHRFLNQGGLKVVDFFEEPLLAWSDVGGSKVKTRAFFVALFDLIKIKMHMSSFSQPAVPEKEQKLLKN